MTSHLKSLNVKTTATYDVKDSGPGVGQAQKCGGVKPYSGIQTLLFWLLNLQRQYIYLFLTENTRYIKSNSMTLLYEFASSLQMLNKWRWDIVHLQDQYKGHLISVVSSIMVEFMKKSMKSFR